MPTTNKSPRILVVAEFAPGAPGGDWVNLKQHFRGLDWGQVYWWSFSGPLAASPREFGGRHSCCHIPVRLLPQRRWNGARSWLAENILVPYAARHLLSFIDTVRPDLVFLMARNWMIPLAHRVMPKTKTHWHVAIYDMPDIEPVVRLLGRRRADRFMGFAETLYRNASSRSVISPPMADDLRLRTGVECANFFRCSVEPEMIARLRQPAPKPEDDIIRICYAGTIHVEDTFVRFITALKSIRHQLSRRVEIHLFGSQLYKSREWFDSDLIIEHGLISEANLDRLYRKGTWGLAIMHLQDTEPRYNHFSFPCKFSMSLASGLPLICIGHRRSGLMELAGNYRLGLRLTEKDMDTLAEKLREGLEDFSPFDEYRAEILRCAETEFNAEANRRKLHKLLYAAAGG